MSEYVAVMEVGNFGELSFDPTTKTIEEDKKKEEEETFKPL